MDNYEMSPHLDSGYDVVEDRRSIDFFISLRDAVVREIAIPDEEELINFLYKMGARLGNIQTISTVLETRSQSPFDIVRNFLRQKIPEHFMSEESIEFGRKAPDFVEKIKNSDLLRWKKYLLDYLKKLEYQTNNLQLLGKAELSPETLDLLQKHGKKNLSELLEPGFPIGEMEMLGLMSDIRSSIEYRHRKICELIAFRYARTASTEVNVEEFIKNTHRIVESGSNGSYRQTFVRNIDTFHAPFGPHLVPHIMSTYQKRVEKNRGGDDISTIQKEALKMYILFEIIHPFSDANGRVGRSLFVFLQRYFAKRQTPGPLPLHMPLARYESGTIYPQHITNKKHQRTNLGSLSLDINTLLIRIIQRDDLCSVGRNLPDFIDMEQKQYSLEELKNLAEPVFAKILEILDSGEIDQQLEELLFIIKKQSAKDDLHSPDWAIIYEAAKEYLKSPRSRADG